MHENVDPARPHTTSHTHKPLPAERRTGRAASKAASKIKAVVKREILTTALATGMVANPTIFESPIAAANPTNGASPNPVTPKAPLKGEKNGDDWTPMENHHLVRLVKEHVLKEKREPDDQLDFDCTFEFRWAVKVKEKWDDPAEWKITCDLHQLDEATDSPPPRTVKMIRDHKGLMNRDRKSLVVDAACDCILEKLSSLLKECGLIGQAVGNVSIRIRVVPAVAESDCQLSCS